MNDFVLETACRICLKDGEYPIFESNEYFESVHAKLPQFIKEKIEDIAGYPRNICIQCKTTSELICDFINNFEETCKILQSKIVTVKTEVQDNSYDDYDMEPFLYELQIENIMNVQSKSEKKESVELLGPLSHPTLKKIKVENDSITKDSGLNEIKDVKKGNESRATAGCNKTEKVEENTVNRVHQSPKGKIKSANLPTAAVTNEDLRISKMTLEEQANRKFQLIVGPPPPPAPIPIHCDVCGQTFRAAENLANHTKRRHTERKFKCTECPKDYVSKKDLQCHMLKKHENMRNFVCDTCGKALISKQNLRLHILRVHERDPSIKRKYTLHKCKFCDRTFTHKRGVVVHERSVHTGDRPAVCSVCESAFYDHVYLAEHMRIHTGDTPFKCPICGRGYAQRGNMKSHMRNHRISELDDETRSKLKPNYFKFMRP